MAGGFSESPRDWGPPPLTARPEGLLDSLGIQSGGKYPQHLLKDLQPTYELGPWYREYEQKFRGADTGAIGLTTFGTYVDTGIQVPDGELWIVNRIGCEVSWGVAANLCQGSVQLCRTNNANTTTLAVSAPQVIWLNSAGTTPTQRVLLGLDYPPFLMRPTVKLRVLFSSHSGPSGTSTPMPASTRIITYLGVTICRV